MLRIATRLRLSASTAVFVSHLALFGLLQEHHLDALVISFAVNLVVVYVSAPYFTAWLFTKDVERIRNFVEALKTGDLKVRLPVRSDPMIEDDINELNQLNQSLNWMARQIEIREQAVQTQLAEVGQREKELKDLVVRDPMTRLFNRQYFHDAVTHALYQLQRHKRPFAVALIDIDLFKAINDTHGHLAGDAVILDLAGLLGRHVRDEDVVARIGGEEFAILVANAETDTARSILARIRHAVENMEVGLDDGRILRITVSIGLATAQFDDRQTGDDLFHRADVALYHVKRNGRNGLMLWQNLSAST